MSNQSSSGNAGNPRGEIESLIRQLAQYEPSLRTEEKKSPLAKVKARLTALASEAFPALIESLTSHQYPLSHHATQILGDIGDQRAIPHLVDALTKEGLDDFAGPALKKFGPLAVPQIICLIQRAITPAPGSNTPPRIYLTQALITLGDIRCEESVEFLNRLLDDYMKEIPPEIFDPAKHEWRFQNVDFFLILDAMVKQQDERAISHIRKTQAFFSEPFTEHKVCHIAVGRIKKKKPEGYLPLEALDITIPASRIMSAFLGKEEPEGDFLEDNYGEFLHDDEEEGTVPDDDSRDKEKRHSDGRKLILEEKLGEQTFRRSLTIPRRRPFKSVYQLKPVLRHTDPHVWRRILVPESYTFYDLHVAIQDVMGWLDYHLHHFEILQDSREHDLVHIECPWFDFYEMDDDWLITTEVCIREYLRNPSDRALYRYDYGDGWEMDVILEKILPRRKNKAYPVCLEGELAGPPEDCGGISGYYECVEAVNAFKGMEEPRAAIDEEDDETMRLLTWLGDWDPDEFNPRKIVFENPWDRFKKAIED